MEKTQLVELEIKVQSLMEKIESVKQENQSLRQRIAAATQDRSILQERHHDAVAKIKNIINQLKEELV